MTLLSLESAAKNLCIKTGGFVPTTFGLQVLRERLVLEQKQSVYLHPVKFIDEIVEVPELPAIKLRIMLPVDVKKDEKLPVLLYIHGGQFVTGDAITYNKLLRELTQRARVCLLFPEYSLAPEYKAPTQLRQIETVYDKLTDFATRYPLDLKRILVTGDDVGGGLAVSLGLAIKKKQLPIYKMLLFYPVVNAYFDTQSYVSFAGGYYLTREQMKWSYKQYHGLIDMEDTCISPLRATLEDLQNLPETLIITAEADVVRDEAESLARKMRDAGVNVSQIRFQGIIHDFVSLHILDKTNACRLAMNIAVDWLKYAE